MFEIMVLVPTRGRPANAQRLYESLMDTADKRVSVEFFVDEDDPYSESYINRLPRSTVNLGTSNRLGPWLNIGSQMHKNDYDMIGFIGDDVICHTEGWDSILRDNYGENMIAYPNDGWQGEGLPTSVFMDTWLIKNLGYMVHPNFKHLYIDNHWKRLGEELETLTYLPEILMEHLHPYSGKSEMDATYEAANHPDMYSSDGAAFQRWEMFELPGAVKRALCQ